MKINFIVVFFIFCSFYSTNRLLDTLNNLIKSKTMGTAALCTAMITMGFFIGLVWGYTSRLAILSITG